MSLRADLQHFASLFFVQRIWCECILKWWAIVWFDLFSNEKKNIFFLVNHWIGFEFILLKMLLTSSFDFSFLRSVLNRILLHFIGNRLQQNVCVFWPGRPSRTKNDRECRERTIKFHRSQSINRIAPFWIDYSATWLCGGNKYFPPIFILWICHRRCRHLSLAITCKTEEKERKNER